MVRTINLWPDNKYLAALVHVQGSELCKLCKAFYNYAHNKFSTETTFLAIITFNSKTKVILSQIINPNRQFQVFCVRYLIGEDWGTSLMLENLGPADFSTFTICSNKLSSGNRSVC